MFHRRKTYRIDEKKAGDSLQNIYAACEQSPYPSPTLNFKKRTGHSARTSVILFAGICVLALILLSSLLAYYYTRNATPSGPVEIASDYVKLPYLYIEVNPNGNIIFYEDAYLITNDGTVYSVASYDKKTHTLCFLYPDEECNIYIPYGEDAKLHLLLTPKQE